MTQTRLLSPIAVLQTERDDLIQDIVSEALRINSNHDNAFMVELSFNHLKRMEVKVTDAGEPFYLLMRPAEARLREIFQISYKSSAGISIVVEPKTAQEDNEELRSCALFLSFFGQPVS